LLYFFHYITVVTVNLSRQIHCTFVYLTDCTSIRISAITIVAAALCDKRECEYIVQIGGFCYYIGFLDAPYFLGSYLPAKFNARFSSKERSITKRTCLKIFSVISKHTERSRIKEFYITRCIFTQFFYNDNLTIFQGLLHFSRSSSTLSYAKSLSFFSHSEHLFTSRIYRYTDNHDIQIIEPRRNAKFIQCLYVRKII